MANAHNELAMSRSALLRERTQAFCNAFLDLANNPPMKLLDEHFSPQPNITEHGPSWAAKRLPFLGVTFSGREECLKYFELLGKSLEFIPSKDTFGTRSNIAIDAEAGNGQDGMAHVTGKASFKAISTGKEWEETFIWRLSGFDEDGKLGHWEIWADPLSAWEAARE